ncbi:MAG: hypothetical protein DMF96_08840 [Acidobacteria bacterium]|nr:MAG: hypothetical protein DMF96_08840 [Acidobacteriota bacterium]
MNPWIAKAVVLAGLLVLAWVGFFIPLIWVASPAFSFAEYPLRSGPLISGVVCGVIGLWLFYRSHADLGTNWSITLEVREHHRLITQGISFKYSRYSRSSRLAGGAPRSSRCDARLSPRAVNVPPRSRTGT